MINERHFLIVHGINQWTANPGWHDQLAREIEARPGPDSATSLPWKGGPVSSLLWRRWNVHVLANHILLNLGWGELHGIAHSYGAVLLAGAMARAHVPFKTVRLFAPACSADWEQNGYAELLRAGLIDEVIVHGGPNDQTLLAVQRRSWRRWVGYGTLGLRSQNLPLELQHRIRLNYKPGREHSWFTSERWWDWTVGTVTQ